MNALPPLAAEAHAASARTGVLLVNLGTPDAPTATAIRAYLRQFLSDRRVVELPRALWLPVLYGFILPFRPRRLVEAYSKVWSAHGSPLLAISREQQAGLRQRLGEEAVVELCMTYGRPSFGMAMDALARAGVRRLLVVPLYPQYSATTTAAAFDALYAELAARRWPPEIRTVNSYHDDSSYIEALADSLQRHWAEHGRADHLLISFHSIPRRYLEAGDPYFCQCHKTARLLAQHLALDPAQWSVSFQSRLGRQPWLQPYTDVVIPELARRGRRSLDVICPGFSADCLETLEEVAIRYREDFLAAGGGEFRYVPSLNAAPLHLDMLAALVRRHLQGWPSDDADRQAGPHQRAQREQRVAALAPSLDHQGLLASVVES